MLDDPGFNSWQEQEICLFSRSSRLVVVPAQTLFSVYCGFYTVVKWLGHIVDQSLLSSTKGKNVWTYTCTFRLCPQSLDRENFTSLTVKTWQFLSF